MRSEASTRSASCPEAGDGYRGRTGPCHVRGRGGARRDHQVADELGGERQTLLCERLAVQEERRGDQRRQHQNRDQRTRGGAAVPAVAAGRGRRVRRTLYARGISRRQQGTGPWRRRHRHRRQKAQRCRRLALHRRVLSEDPQAEDAGAGDHGNGRLPLLYEATPVCRGTTGRGARSVASSAITGSSGRWAASRSYCRSARSIRPSRRAWSMVPACRQPG